MKRIIIGTRASKLAMIQTQWVVEQLRRQWPNLEIAVEQIRTTGDRITNVPLSQIGGEGVFVLEIEHALREQRIDLAVHSLKDLPTAQPDGLRIVVAGPREDVRDVFVSNVPFQISEDGLHPVLPGTEHATALRIGTSSLRRTAQLRELCPAAQIVSLRGNVDTRLRKLESGDYDGIVLASAGLHRLELQEHLAGRLTYFPIETMLPAPGQGALALEIRDEPEMHTLLAPLNDTAVQATTAAERMFMRRLGAGCYLPVAAYGEIVDETLTLSGLVISLDGQRRIRVRQCMRWTSEVNIKHAEQLGVSLAEQALAQGAYEIIHEIDALREQNVSEQSVVPLPLQGKRILVTRTRDQASALSERLRALGASPVEFPTIRIMPPQDWGQLDTALKRLYATGGVKSDVHEEYSYDWLVFTSANGVNMCLERLLTLGYDPCAIQNIRVAAIGPATAAALARYGITTDIVPDEYIAEGVAAALIEDVRKRGISLKGQHILLARAAEARKVLVSELQQAGALVDEVAAYYTVSVARDDEQGREVLRLLQQHQLDMLTFTSSSTVRNFIIWLKSCGQSVPGEPLDLVTHQTQLSIACIGPITSRTARELGLHVDIEAKEFTIDGLVEAIVQYVHY